MVLIVLGPLGAVAAFLGVLGVALLVGRVRAPERGREHVRRWRALRGRAVDTVGPVGAFGVLFGAGMFAVTAVGIVLGELLALLEDPVDRPILRWVADVQRDGWADPMLWIGKMGNLTQTRSVALVAAIVLALVVRRRRWVPPLVIGTTVVVQKYGQAALAKIVDRGHPPTTLGTYPSGGVARTIVIYGVIVFLVLAALGAGRRGYAVGWGLVAMLGYVEGYTRTYLNKHWFTDVAGAWLLGALMLALIVYAARALLPMPGGGAGSAPDGRRAPALAGAGGGPGSADRG